MFLQPQRGILHGINVRERITKTAGENIILKVPFFEVRAFLLTTLELCMKYPRFVYGHDPVCLMIVDEDAGKFTSTYKNLKYYFCCNWCKKKFDEDPRKYSRITCDLNIEPGGMSC